MARPRIDVFPLSRSGLKAIHEIKAASDRLKFLEQQYGFTVEQAEMAFQSNLDWLKAEAQTQAEKQAEKRVERTQAAIKKSVGYRRQVELANRAARRLARSTEDQR